MTLPNKQWQVKITRTRSQVIYFFKSVLDLNLSEGEINFSVPTGNFGDVYAGYITKKMGLPIHKLLIATNANDILKRTMACQSVHEGN